MKNDNKNLFEWFLVITTFIVLYIAAYESYMQSHLPPYSILNLLHKFRILNNYQIIYEPSKGIWHAVGWTGSAMMVIMMFYSIRKRFTMFAYLGSLRHWLSAHMFLGIMGPILVTFHTTFKLGGIIATSFWCMIVTMIFGILGRYIYIQIPRNLSGAELEVKDINAIVEALNKSLGKYLSETNISVLLKMKSKEEEINPVHEEGESLNLISSLLYMIKSDIINIYNIYYIRGLLKKTVFRLNENERNEVVSILWKKASMIRRINFLSTSHRLLHYWHVFHVPLAIVMFIIMFLHVIVYFLFTAGSHAV